MSRILTSFLSIIVLGVFTALAAASGGSDEEGSASTSRAGSNERHGLNSEVRLGDTSVTVASVTTATRVGSEFFQETANAGSSFVIVRYSETNHGNETITTFGSPFKLVDGQGRRFEPANNAESALAAAEHMQLLPQLQPGVANNGVAVFQVPTAVAQSEIQLEFNERGLLGSGRATITAPRPAAAPEPPSAPSAEAPPG